MAGSNGEAADYHARALILCGVIFSTLASRAAEKIQGKSTSATARLRRSCNPICLLCCSGRRPGGCHPEPRAVPVAASRRGQRVRGDRRDGLMKRGVKVRKMSLLVGEEEYTEGATAGD